MTLVFCFELRIRKIHGFGKYIILGNMYRQASKYVSFLLKVKKEIIQLYILLFFFVLGGIILGMNAKGCRLQHWSDMIKCPGQAHAKTHYLSANYID